ncbi:MAG: response regulator [Pseudomonadota bacterium]
MTVLIVDDSSIFRRQLREDLEDAAIAVEEAGDAIAAMTKLRTGAPFDLMICDVNMPGIDGLSFAESAEERTGRPLPPTFILSAERSASARERARVIGAKAWIIKPYNKDALIGAVRKVTGEGQA